MRQIIEKSIASPTVRTISSLAGSDVLALAVGIVGTLVQARFVGPEELGYFRTFAIVTGYALFLDLGLTDALRRLYPYYVGRESRERGLAVAEICQSWNVMVTVVITTAFIVAGAAMLIHGNWRAWLGWWAQAVAVAGSTYGYYLGVTYRSGQDFKGVAKASLLSSIVNLMVLPLFPFWSYCALALRSCLGGLCSLAYLHVHRPLRLPWRFNWREWLQHFKEGMPIFSAGYGKTTGATVVESTVILHFLGTTSLGLWSLSVMSLEMANKIPQAITTVYMPRLIEHYGRTHSVRDCLKLCRAPLIWGTLSALFCAAMCCAAIPFAVRGLMPSYVAAIPTMWLMMATLPLIVLELPFSVLVAMGKPGQQNTAVYAGMGVFLLLAIGAIKQGLGLNGVVGASIAGRVTRLTMTYLFLSIGCRRSRSSAGGAGVKNVVQLEA